MGRIRDLLMFANLADFRRAINDRQKAVRVIKSIFFQTSSSIERIDNPEEEVKSTVQQLFGISQSEVEELFKQAKDFEKNELGPKLDEFTELPFGPGGMAMGGKTLYVITRLVKPETILEIGVANGMSTAFVLGALDEEGVPPESVTIHAIDRPQFAYQIQERRGRFGLEGRGGLIPDNKEAGWLASKMIRQKYNYQLHIGDFTEILGDFSEIFDSLDLAIYDASKDPEEMKFAYQFLLTKLQRNGVLVSDDVLVNDIFEAMMEGQRGRSRIVNDTGIYVNQQYSAYR